MNKKMLQTQFSIRATDLAESFRDTVGRLRVGPHGYIPDMTSPDGPSTGGGVQALQHIRLTPPQPTLPTLVVGQANQRDATAELRTLEHVDAICRERFRQPAPLDPASYAQFLEATQSFLASCGLRATLAGPPADLGAPRSRSEGAALPPKSNSGLLIAIAAAVMVSGLIAASVWFFGFKG